MVELRKPCGSDGKGPNEGYDAGPSPLWVEPSVAEVIQWLIEHSDPHISQRCPQHWKCKDPKRTRREVESCEATHYEVVCFSLPYQGGAMNLETSPAIGQRISVYDQGAARLAEIVGEPYFGEEGTVTAVADDGTLIVHWDMTDTTAPWSGQYTLVEEKP